MNQRPIKFRAWNTNENRMIQGQEMLFKAIQVKTDPRLETYEPFGDNKTPPAHIEFRMTMDMREWFIQDLQSKYVLMQFTGLHDKNGKEIWEGDIVRAESGDVWKITFEYGSFGAARDNSPWMKNGDWMSGAIVSFHNQRFEVIGNVWESPNLLEDVE